MNNLNYLHKTRDQLPVAKHIEFESYLLGILSAKCPSPLWKEAVDFAKQLVDEVAGRLDSK